MPNSVGQIWPTKLYCCTATVAKNIKHIMYRVVWTKSVPKVGWMRRPMVMFERANAMTSVALVSHIYPPDTGHLTPFTHVGHYWPADSGL